MLRSGVVFVVAALFLCARAQNDDAYAAVVQPPLPNVVPPSPPSVPSSGNGNVVPAPGNPANGGPTTGNRRRAVARERVGPNSNQAQSPRVVAPPRGFVGARPQQRGQQRQGNLLGIDGQITAFERPAKFSSNRISEIQTAVDEKAAIAARITTADANRANQIGIPAWLDVAKAAKDLSRVGLAVQAAFGSLANANGASIAALQNDQSLHAAARSVLNFFLADTGGLSTTTNQQQPQAAPVVNDNDKLGPATGRLAMAFRRAKSKEKADQKLSNGEDIRTDKVAFYAGDKLMVRFGQAGDEDPRTLGMLMSTWNRLLTFSDAELPQGFRLGLAKAFSNTVSTVVRDAANHMLGLSAQLPPNLKKTFNDWMAQGVAYLQQNNIPPPNPVPTLQ